VDVQARADEQSGDTDAVRHLLDHVAGRAQRWRRHPLAAVAVDNDAEGEVASRHDAHAQVHGFVVVPRPPHLGDDGQESRGAGARAEDGRHRSDGSHEGRIADDVVAEVVITRLGRRCRAIECGHADDDDEDSNEDGDETRPGQPSDLLKLSQAGQDEHHDHGDKHKVVGANGMVGKRIEGYGSAEDATGTDDGESDQKQDAHHFTQPFTSNNLGHVGDGVAAGVSVAEVALDNGAVRVQKLPAQHVDGARKGPKDVHGRGDREDTRGEDDYLLLVLSPSSGGVVTRRRTL